MTAAAVVLAVFAALATTPTAVLGLTEYNVINTYNDANCAGAVNQTWLQGVSGACYPAYGQATQQSCNVVKVYEGATCTGNFTTFEHLECLPHEDQPNVWWKLMCATFTTPTASVTTSDVGNCTVLPDMVGMGAMVAPLGVCMSSPLNAGNYDYHGYYDPEGPPGSFKVTELEKGSYSFAYWNSTADCSGESNGTVLTGPSGCVKKDLTDFVPSMNLLMIALLDTTSAASKPSAAVNMAAAVTKTLGATVLAAVAMLF